MELEEEVLAPNDDRLVLRVDVVVEVRADRVVPQADGIWVDNGVMLEGLEQVSCILRGDILALPEVVLPEWMDLPKVLLLPAEALEPEVRLLHHQHCKHVAGHGLRHVMVHPVLPQRALLGGPPAADDLHVEALLQLPRDRVRAGVVEAHEQHLVEGPHDDVRFGRPPAARPQQHALPRGHGPPRRRRVVHGAPEDQRPDVQGGHDLPQALLNLRHAGCVLVQLAVRLADGVGERGLEPAHVLDALVHEPHVEDVSVHSEGCDCEPQAFSCAGRLR
mmetsp:Transcript_23786/g.68054  ORF Transcript_23786/g.68054 Transcript_23786/m.68054 type:complete len:276 (-) Transcript_23786:639-1466(-)